MSTEATNLYLVIDDGRPVRRFPHRHGSPEYYPGCDRSNRPISIFDSYALARRVKNMLRREHRSRANCFDPKRSEEDKRCFHLWESRANRVHIRRVVTDDLEGQR